MHQVLVTTVQSNISPPHIIRVLQQKAYLSLSQAMEACHLLYKNIPAPLTLTVESLEEATELVSSLKDIGLHGEIHSLSASQYKEIQKEIQAKEKEQILWKQREASLLKRGISLPVTYIGRNILYQNIEDLKRRLEENPLDINTNLYLAGIYLIENDNEEAASACLNAINELKKKDLHGNSVLASKRALAHFLLGCVYLSGEQIKQARNEWEIALQISAGVPERTGFSLGAGDIARKTKRLLDKFHA